MGSVRFGQDAMLLWRVACLTLASYSKIGIPIRGFRVPVPGTRRCGTAPVSYYCTYIEPFLLIARLACVVRSDH
jgi:hypothetical protein